MNFRWKVYFFVFSSITIGRLAGMMSPETTAYGYYNILIAFNPEFQLKYDLAIISGVVGIITLVPLYLFTFKIKFLSVGVWRFLFFLKLISDILGHSYELKTIRALYHTEILLSVSAACLGLAVVLPFYSAFFIYAFRRKTIFKD